MDENGQCWVCRIEEQLNEVWSMTMPKQPRYRYWKLKREKGKSERTFEWTTETADAGKYWAIERRWIRTKRGQVGKIVRKVGFRTRTKAKERAYAWFAKASTSTNPVTE